MKKNNLSKSGFFQALGVVAYCLLIASVLFNLEKLFITPPGFMGVTIILILLVFSATICGSIVFGYPVYLALHNRIKEAISLLAFTLLYCLGLTLVIILLTFLLK